MSFQRVAMAAGVSAASLLSACTPVRFLNTITFWGQYSLARDVAYGDGRLRLDVYTPKGASAAPVVFFIYGGSWQQGTTLGKENYKFVGQAFAAQGFVTIIPDYRVFPEVRFPGFIEDCAQAVRWGQDHVAQFGGDPQRMVLVGHSAGAYNAAMLVLAPSYLHDAGVRRDAIRGMVGLAGPYDFLPLSDAVLEAIFAPAVPLSASQPVSFVRGDNPPMLLLAGRDDDTVYARNTQRLAARIREQGGPVEVLIYPHMSHIRMVATLATLLQGGSDVADRSSAFVRQVTAPAKTALPSP